MKWPSHAFNPTAVQFSLKRRNSIGESVISYVYSGHNAKYTTYMHLWPITSMLQVMVYRVLVLDMKAWGDFKYYSCHMCVEITLWKICYHILEVNTSNEMFGLTRYNCIAICMCQDINTISISLKYISISYPRLSKIQDLGAVSI